MVRNAKVALANRALLLELQLEAQAKEKAGIQSVLHGKGDELKSTKDWAKEEQRALKEVAMKYISCRHCSQPLDLRIARGSRAGINKRAQLRCRHCRTKYSDF